MPLVAKPTRQSSGTTCSSEARILRLVARSSVAASRTYSQPASFWSSSVGSRRLRIASASFAESFPRARAFSMYPSMRFTPASSASWRMSWSATVPPIRAAAVRNP
jgi:hypothetical protein